MKSVTRNRTRGRPAAGSLNQREQLLDAARDQFADQGFAGSSLRQIANRAGVTPALTHYYFTDKASLLQAVIQERVMPLVGQVRQSVELQNDDPVAALAGFVQQYTALASRNAWLPQLIVREVLNERGVLRDEFHQNIARPITLLLDRLVQRGQASGAIRRDLESRNIVLSVMSLCVFPFVARKTVAAALGIALDPAAASQLTLHHIAVLTNGLTSRPESLP